MDDVRGDLLGPPHGTTRAAVIANKIENAFLSSDDIQKEEIGHTAVSVSKTSFI